MPTPVLFARTDSIYKNFDCDVYDINRNAFTWAGESPVIAHPPCRLFGRLRKFSNAPGCEKLGAYFSVLMIRRYGGILEHPYPSTLWAEMQLPKPGEVDSYGGICISINQSWFGHKAEKKTLLYIVGTTYKQLPLIPISFDAVQYVITSTSKKYGKKRCTHAAREHTPYRLAKWLIEVSRIIEDNFLRKKL